MVAPNGLRTKVKQGEIDPREALKELKKEKCTNPNILNWLQNKIKQNVVVVKPTETTEEIVVKPVKKYQKPRRS